MRLLSKTMYNQKSLILFDTVGKKNTEITIDAVIGYCSTHIDVATIFVSSTTGFTACSLLERLKDTSIINQYCVFTQYLDDSHYMQDCVRERLQATALVQEVFEVPQKYLNQVIGQAGVDSLRELSHGIKVCIELAYFAQTKQLLKEDQKFIVIAGRVEGADTAVVFKKKQTSVKMIDI